MEKFFDYSELLPFHLIKPGVVDESLVALIIDVNENIDGLLESFDFRISDEILVRVEVFRSPVRWRHSAAELTGLFLAGFVRLFADCWKKKSQ